MVLGDDISPKPITQNPTLIVVAAMAAAPVAGWVRCGVAWLLASRSGRSRLPAEAARQHRARSLRSVVDLMSGSVRSLDVPAHVVEVERYPAGVVRCRRPGVLGEMPITPPSALADQRPGLALERVAEDSPSEPPARWSGPRSPVARGGYGSGTPQAGSRAERRRQLSQNCGRGAAVCTAVDQQPCVVLDR